MTTIDVFIFDEVKFMEDIDTFKKRNISNPADGVWSSYFTKTKKLQTELFTSISIDNFEFIEIDNEFLYKNACLYKNSVPYNEFYPYSELRRKERLIEIYSSKYRPWFTEKIKSLMGRNLKIDKLLNEFN